MPRNVAALAVGVGGRGKGSRRVRLSLGRLAAGRARTPQQSVGALATSNALRLRPLGILLAGDPNSSPPGGSLGGGEAHLFHLVGSIGDFCPGAASLIFRQSSQGDWGPLQDGGQGGVVDVLDYRKHQASDPPP